MIDFEQVKYLYDHYLNFLMTESYYRYLYFHNGKFTSFVSVENGNIVGHHAYIPYKQKINNTWYQVATLSGAVVNPEKSGVYLSLLKETINSCKSDIVVAFPNINSQDFFTRLLRFSTIENNYYSINNKISSREFDVDYKIEIDQKTIKKRFEIHPLNQYKIYQLETTQIVYKEYNGSIDILYCNQFNNSFIDFVNNKLNNYASINLIFYNPTQIEKLGFKKAPNNKFVYKFLSYSCLTIFPCQMFNSDVF